MWKDFERIPFKKSGKQIGNEARKEAISFRSKRKNSAKSMDFQMDSVGWEEKKNGLHD